MANEELSIDLDAWLSAHPAIANAIVFEGPRVAAAWPSWSPGRKKELAEAFHLARAGRSVPVEDVPRNR